MSIKFQGLVGVARRPRSSGDREGRSITRLTWLMNMDFQGLVPVVAVQSALLTSAAYPQIKLLELEKWTHGKKEADLADTLAKTREMLRGKDDELNRARRYFDESAEKHRALQSEKDAEIKRLRKEVLEMREKLKKA